MAAGTARDCLESVREAYHRSITALLRDTQGHSMASEWYTLWFLLFPDDGVKAHHLEQWVENLQSLTKRPTPFMKRAWEALWKNLADNPERVVTTSADRRQQLLAKYLSKTGDEELLSVAGQALQRAPQPGSDLKGRLRRMWERKKDMRACGAYAVWQPVYALSDDPDEKYQVLREGLTRAMSGCLIREWDSQQKWHAMLKAHLEQYPEHRERLREDWFRQVEKGEADDECCAGWTGLSLIGGGAHEKRLLEIFRARLAPFVPGERREKSIPATELIAMATWCPQESTVRDEWLEWWKDSIREFHAGRPWPPEWFLIPGACVAASVAARPEEYIGKWGPGAGGQVKAWHTQDWDTLRWGLKRMCATLPAGKPDEQKGGQKGGRNVAEVVLEFVDNRKCGETDREVIWSTVCPYLPPGKVVEQLEAFLSRETWSPQDVQAAWLEGSPGRWLGSAVDYLQQNRIGAQVTADRLVYLTEAAFNYYTVVKTLPYIDSRLPKDLVLALLSASLHRAAEDRNAPGHHLPVRQIITGLLGTEPSAWERVCRKAIRWWGDNQAICGCLQNFWVEKLADGSLDSRREALYCLGLMAKWQPDFQAAPELWECLETMVREEKEATLFVGAALLGNHLSRRGGERRLARWAKTLTGAGQTLTTDIAGIRWPVTQVDFHQLVRREFLLGQAGLIPTNRFCRDMNVDDTWKKIHLREVCRLFPNLWQIDEEAGRRIFRWAGITRPGLADMASNLQRAMALQLDMGRPWQYAAVPPSSILSVRSRITDETETQGGEVFARSPTGTRQTGSDRRYRPWNNTGQQV